MKKRCFVLLLAFILALNLAAAAAAANTADVNAAVSDTAQYILNLVKNPQVGSVGGEWAVFGLVRSGYDVPQAYYDAYFQTVTEYVTACKGVLHDKKYTEYSRVIIALTAAGFDPRNVAGYDLTVPLGDFDKTIWQGINGPVFALIALDCGGYDIPKNPDAETGATRDKYIAEILRRQLSNGGFNLTAGAYGNVDPSEKADPDITAMALQALARYQDKPEVKAATEKALSCLSEMQDSDGGYSSWGTTNSESVVQVLVALCELGISIDDTRFVKNGNTLADNLLTFYKKGAGFSHTSTGVGSSQMATEQGFYGLVALQRIMSGKTSLYRISDVEVNVTDADISGNSGLTGKDKDVSPMPIINPGRTFADIAAHPNQKSIEALASRGIINGKTGDSFVPDATMTRAEFSTIIVRGLGLPQNAASNFTDVPSSAWFAPYVGAAYKYGIVTGRTGTSFDPDGTITRQEAAVMIARAAKLCGMNTDMSEGVVREILAQFDDYLTIDDWARGAFAVCYDADILPQHELEARPNSEITRAEIAEMLFRMLSAVRLL